jgi:hypothetical protein
MGKMKWEQADPLDQLSQTVLEKLIVQHYAKVECPECKRQTTFGESCCGQTECDLACPVCRKLFGGAK